MARKPLTRQSQSSKPQDAPQALDYTPLAAAYPNLVSHLFDECYEDGTRRVTSTLLFFVERGILKCCLNDRDASRCVFISAESVEAALLSIETGLLEDTLDWRQRRS